MMLSRFALDDTATRFFITRWLIVALALAFVAGPESVQAAEQEVPSAGFPIYGIVCDAVPEITSRFQGNFPPDGCRGQAGIEMQVETPTGEPVASCRTGDDGRCVIPNLAEALIIMRQVDDTVPAGFTPLENPVLTWNYTEFRGASFFNVPDQLAAATPAANGATLRIHSRVCPAGFTGTDYDGACHDTPPDYKQTLFLSGPPDLTAVIDDTGNAAFENLPAGEYALQPGLPEATERVVSFCSREGAPGVEYPSAVQHDEATPPNLYSVEVSLETGIDVLCDVFTVPSA